MDAVLADRLAARRALRPPATVAAVRPSVASVLPTASRGRALPTGPESPAARGLSAAYRPGKWDIWFLGIAIGFGGQFFSWNAGLQAGLYSFLAAYAVVGLAYIALCCCTSEITGALPFAGGAYGLSRCTLGLYAGFVIGCVEALEYVTYVSTAVLSLCNMLVEVAPALEGSQPALALALYASALVVHCRGGRLFWRWNLCIGLLSLVCVLLYCAGSFRAADFARNADTDPRLRFVGGLRGFVAQMPLACWFFVGVEALSLASDDVPSPRTVIPLAQLSCILVLFGVGVVVLLVTVSLPPPGLLQVSKLLAPFNNGFQQLFDVSPAVATLFSIPAMYATAFGFMWGYGKLISAMATSKLLPPALAHAHPRFGTPANAVLFGSALSYALLLLVYLARGVDKYLYNVCMAAAFLGYASQCVGYVALRVSYPNIRSSSFRSPLGVPGALYSLAVWLLGLVSVCGFQEHSEVELAVVAVVVAVLSLFYLAYARPRQTFSEQETRVFLLAHVTKLGQRGKRRQLQRCRPARGGRSSGSPRRSQLQQRLSAHWPRSKPANKAPAELFWLSSSASETPRDSAASARVVVPAGRSVEALRRVSLAIAREDEGGRLPAGDPARAETPFCRHYCHAVPADPFRPWPEGRDGGSCCFPEAPRRLALEAEGEAEGEGDGEGEGEGEGGRRRQYRQQIEREEMEGEEGEEGRRAVELYGWTK